MAKLKMWSHGIYRNSSWGQFYVCLNSASTGLGELKSFFPNAKILMNSEPFSTLQSLLIISQKCKWVWCLWDCLNGLDGGIDRWWAILISPWRVAWIGLKRCLRWTLHTVHPTSFSSSPNQQGSMYWAYQTLTKQSQRNQVAIHILSCGSFTPLSHM